jgi:hypothetical protein
MDGIFTEDCQQILVQKTDHLKNPFFTSLCTNSGCSKEGSSGGCAEKSRTRLGVFSWNGFFNLVPEEGIEPPTKGL